MNQPLTVSRDFHVIRRQRGCKKFRDGSAPENPTGRVPRIARLMALALHCEHLIRAGVVADQTELARMGHITKSRMTQIMALLNLATDIQEQILFLRCTQGGRDAIKERDIRPIAASIEWMTQRRMWSALQSTLGSKKT
jgi:hypothetical protein